MSGDTGLGKIGVGLYGNNGGHQIHDLLVDHPDAKVVAFAAMDKQQLDLVQQSDPDVRQYETLEEMLEDERILLVSLCSPSRAEQANEAILILRKGKHVYAEKPCALNEDDLDRIIATAAETGYSFREMASTGFEQPYYAIRDIVKSGAIGEVVQVFAQKSYPYHDRRPQNEDIDGGLIGQNGIHAVRYIEHVAGVRIKKVYAIETKLGNPRRDAGGGLHMAASMMMELENGGVASIVANYLNMKGFGSWGNEHLRIFGTEGFVESVDGGARTRLVIGDRDLGAIDATGPVDHYFTLYVRSLRGHAELPLSSEDELHCTRVVIRALESAKLHTKNET
jgi:predicted dehydrogenase